MRLVEQSTQMGTTALIEGDKALAQQVVDGDQAIDEVFLDIETRALTLLAQQAPVAGDLRLDRSGSPRGQRSRASR